MKQFVTNRYLEAQALGTSFNGPAFPCQCLYAPYIQITVSAASSLNVAFKVQGTNDIAPLTGQPQNWVDLTEFTAKASVTANGTVYWYLPTAMVSFDFLRVVGTNTAGTGTASICISGMRS